MAEHDVAFLREQLRRQKKAKESNAATLNKVERMLEAGDAGGALGVLRIRRAAQAEWRAQQK